MKKVYYQEDSSAPLQFDVRECLNGWGVFIENVELKASTILTPEIAGRIDLQLPEGYKGIHSSFVTTKREMLEISRLNRLREVDFC